MLQTSTLRPGLLVSLKTCLRGNVCYRTTDIEPDHIVVSGARQAKWETERTIADPAEHKRAVKARSKARSIITGACAQSAFGLLCPESNADNLERAMRDADAVVREFNATATVTRLQVYAFTARVEQDDARAMRAINSEVRDLMTDMQLGIENMDAPAIREAANKLNGVGKMLTPQAQARVQAAIDAVRKTARAIVKAGETAAIEIDQSALKQLQESRTAFLELDSPVGDVAAPDAEARGVDFDAPTARDISGADWMDNRDINGRAAIDIE